WTFNALVEARPRSISMTAGKHVVRVAGFRILLFCRVWYVALVPVKKPACPLLWTARQFSQPDAPMPTPDHHDDGHSDLSETELWVWDSPAEIRYLVLPMRPPGTEGWSEERLAGLVTRDAMIGTGLPMNPGGIAA